MWGIIATSYPPGHNLWPGTPVEWVLRWTGMFLLVVGPALTAIVCSTILFRRRRWMPLAIVLIVVGYLIAFAVAKINVHDGDMPAVRGFMFGTRLLPWVSIAGLIVVLYAAVRPSELPAQRGFPVSDENVGF
jgi:ABC-type branched-subunit amino acid transport system permease subunit